MILRKGLRRDLLLLMGSFGDFVEQSSTRTIGRRIHEMDYRPRSWASQIYRMTQIGELERVIDKKGRPCLRLTSAGRETLSQNIPLFNEQRKRWDGWWRLVVFDIPEETRYQRVSLQRKLVQLGFGQWQRSVYISPHDVMGEMNDYLEVSGLDELAYSLRASQGSKERARDLAYQVWQLDKVAEQYEDFIYRWGPAGEGGQDIELWAGYQQLIEADPFLPRELLPDYWPAKEANKIFRQAIRKMASQT